MAGVDATAVADLPLLLSLLMLFVAAVVYSGTVNSWVSSFFPRTRSTCDSRTDDPTSHLEACAKELELSGDIKGAMQSLLSSHEGGSSRAVMLAHELSQRHPDSLPRWACPAKSQGREDESRHRTPTHAATSPATVERLDAADAVASIEALPPSLSQHTHHAHAKGDTACSEPFVGLVLDSSAIADGIDVSWSRTDPTSTRSPSMRVGAGDADGGGRSDPECFDNEATQLMKPKSRRQRSEPQIVRQGPACGEDDLRDGKTPWERGWRGPKGFKPPATSLSSSSSQSGHDRNAAAAAPAAAGDAGLPLSRRRIGGGVAALSQSSLRNFTVAQLNSFNGSVRAPAMRGGVLRAGKPRPIYVALRGKVYDVSAGRDLYGPEGKYAEFAGHDISRRVAQGLGAVGSSGTREGDNDLDDLAFEDLGRFEKMTLTGWEDTFAARGYPPLGKVVEPPPPRAFQRAELRAFDGTQCSTGMDRGEDEGRDGGRGEESLSSPHENLPPPGYAVRPIYMGVKDKVFDVSFGGSEFYLAGGAYECLAGRDASRVLAKMSMTREDIEGVLDYDHLTERESKNLEDWVGKLGELGKGYPVVGYLSLDGSDA